MCGDIVAFERSSMRLVEQLKGSLAAERQLPDEEAEEGVAGDALLDPQVLSMGLKQRARRYLARQRAPEHWQVCPDCLPLPGDELIGASLEDPTMDTARNGYIHCAIGECPTLRAHLPLALKYLLRRDLPQQP